MLFHWWGAWMYKQTAKGDPTFTSESRRSRVSKACVEKDAWTTTCWGRYAHVPSLLVALLWRWVDLRWPVVRPRRLFLGLRRQASVWSWLAQRLVHILGRPLTFAQRYGIFDTGCCFVHQASALLQRSGWTFNG